MDSGAGIDPCVTLYLRTYHRRLKTKAAGQIEPAFAFAEYTDVVTGAGGQVMDHNERAGALASWAM